MVYLNQEDIDIRIYNAKCCTATLADKTFKEYRLGMKCANRNLETLFLLTMIIQVLECYEPITEESEEDTNCISEENAQKLFDKISDICKTCFETINKTY